ncbi:unnamed protein product, partial [Meganyctiphanes norvegica]
MHTVTQDVLLNLHMLNCYLPTVGVSFFLLQNNHVLLWNVCVRIHIKAASICLSDFEKKYKILIKKKIYIDIINHFSKLGQSITHFWPSKNLEIADPYGSAITNKGIHKFVSGSNSLLQVCINDLIQCKRLHFPYGKNIFAGYLHLICGSAVLEINTYKLLPIINSRCLYLIVEPISNKYWKGGHKICSENRVDDITGKWRLNAHVTYVQGDIFIPTKYEISLIIKIYVQYFCTYKINFNDIIQPCPLAKKEGDRNLNIFMKDVPTHVMTLHKKAFRNPRSAFHGGVLASGIMEIMTHDVNESIIGTLIKQDEMDKPEESFTIVEQSQIDKFNTFKIIILGESYVGKAWILARMVDKNGNFPYIATGTEFKIKNMIINGEEKKFQLWKLPGQERFRTINALSYRNSHGVMLIYDITKRSSLKEIGLLIGHLRENGLEKVPKILIGNKCDLTEKRQIPKEEGSALAEKHGMLFMEVSAVSHTNIEEAFYAIANKIISDKPSAQKHMYKYNKKGLKKGKMK